MTTAVKIAGIAFVLSAVGAGLTGCGGSDSDSDGGSGSSASEDVTKDGFCKQFNTLYDNLSSADPEDTSGAIQGFKDWADEMDDYGTPKEMTDEAEDGFDVVISTIKGLDDDASIEDFQNLDQDLSDADNKAAEAFGSWTTENCPAPELSLPSDDAS
jgi:hypothetical protein